MPETDSQLAKAQNCPLCAKPSPLFYDKHKRRYFKCSHCLLLFMDTRLRLSPKEEKKRYEEHNNDVSDPGFQNFVSPITDAVQKDYTKQDSGLDFGSGTGPVVTKVLRDAGYKLHSYDPFFCNKPELLSRSYNYICASEVIEHFYNPLKEFELLYSLLKPGGKLYCLSGIYDESYDFERWRYKNDPTHVVIYHKKSLSWVKEKFSFSSLVVTGRLAVFSKAGAADM